MDRRVEAAVPAPDTGPPGPPGWPGAADLAGPPDLAASLARAQRGDPDAFRALYRDTQPRLLRYLHALPATAAADLPSAASLRTAPPSPPSRPRRAPGAGGNPQPRTTDAAERCEEGRDRRSDRSEGFDAEGHEMSTRHPWRINREAAEQLLDGAAGPGAHPDQLARVLAAAAAPGRERELAGEAMAVAAFEAHHLAPLASPRRA